MKADLKVVPPTDITPRYNSEISAQTQTTDTRIGNLSFENGYPTEETARKLFDELDYQRAVQAVLRARRKRPAGLEANWIETLPGKGFYPMFRFYYPMAGLFDGTWKLPDIELVKMTHDSAGK